MTSIIAQRMRVAMLRCG